METIAVVVGMCVLVLVGIKVTKWLRIARGEDPDELVGMDMEAGGWIRLLVFAVCIGLILLITILVVANLEGR